MLDQSKPICPECGEQVEQPDALNRRGFIRVVGERTAALLAAGSLGGVVGNVRADAPAAAAKPAKPAEELVRELFASLAPDQRRQVVMPWDHGAGNNRLPSRLRMYNAPLGTPIGKVYSRPQQELIDRILHSISAGEDGYRRISRGGTWDNSGSLQNCGAYIFGEPTEGQKYSWVFTGHHLTVRCDGNSEEAAAFGGPMYYGHSPNGYSERNIFFYQTRRVLSVYDALSEEQRRRAVLDGSPGEQAPSVQFRRQGEAHPGLCLADMSRDQRAQVDAVLGDLLSPYRREDADEVMQIVRATGGMEKIHLAFYRDAAMEDGQRWHFWRLEGPGFVWNYRVLPHVHCYVNISSRV